MKEIGLRELILPRMYGVTEISGFEAHSDYSGSCSSLKIRQNPYMVNPDLMPYAQKLLSAREVGPQSKNPRALLEFNVTSWKFKIRGLLRFFDQLDSVEVGPPSLNDLHSLRQHGQERTEAPASVVVLVE